MVNLGETFDLVNIKYPAEELAPGGVGGSGRSLAPNTLAGLNVTSLELEIPTACLTAGSEPVIGGMDDGQHPPGRHPELASAE